MSNLMRCYVPGCVAEGLPDKHHITYDPEVTVNLCRKHHEEITIINGQQARKHHQELSNKQRWWIWYQWLEGKLKPRRTKRALEWIKA